ncbi:glycine cleavage system H protein [Naumannella halotolerans]|uniref:Glycine cleavage system H protein n=2 Tax=Naumannella halotolerans TaxID=993414 RepID=A0A4R7J7A0_9ACTN|nr:glycine cleavage system H protein [Naumannella halotolerans]
MMSDFPEDLRYSSEHEWVRVGNSGVARIGITAYAAEQLGDIVYAQLPEPGEEISAGDAVGELESTKSVSDLFTPVSGVVSAVNESLADSPETINAEPYGDGWLFEVELSDTDALDELLDADSYAESVSS